MMNRAWLQRFRTRVGSVIASSDVSIWAIVGGWRGLVDVIGPHLLFLVVYLVNQSIVMAIGVALAVSLALMIVRLVTFQSTRQALGGVALVGLSGLIATSTGHEANFYLLQVLRSLALAALLLASLAVRRPLVGVILAPFIEGPSWRDPVLSRAFWQCTAIWAAIAVGRSVVKIPLYLTNNVVGLGVAHLVTGIPLFAVMIYWQLRILRRAYGSTRLYREPPS
jgi:hypothetical protein